MYEKKEAHKFDKSFLKLSRRDTIMRKSSVIPVGTFIVKNEG